MTSADQPVRERPRAPALAAPGAASSRAQPARARSDPTRIDASGRLLWLVHAADGHSALGSLVAPLAPGLVAHDSTPAARDLAREIARMTGAPSAEFPDTKGAPGAPGAPSATGAARLDARWLLARAPDESLAVVCADGAALLCLAAELVGLPAGAAGALALDPGRAALLAECSVPGAAPVFALARFNVADPCAPYPGDSERRAAPRAERRAP
jgi:hypothetical protein